MQNLEQHLTDADRAIIEAGKWSRRIPELENANTSGWRPGWAVQLRLYPPTGQLETVCSPSERQAVKK